MLSMDDVPYYQPQAMDMSSYVAVTGAHSKDGCQVFGCTPREVRYLRVSIHNIYCTPREVRYLRVSIHILYT